MDAPGARPEEAERPRGARWATPLAWLDDRWTRFETWLVIVALGLEISSMSVWVFLKGMSTPSGGGSQAGAVFRSIAGATLIGLSLHFGLAKRHPVTRRTWTIVGVTVGLLLGRAWASVGVDYTSNLLNWYQQASFLTLLGGLRGCMKDADCDPSSVCFCGDPVGSCIPATCVDDSACAPGLVCASSSGSRSGGMSAFACQTAGDECLGDADCGTDRKCELQGTIRVCVSTCFLPPTPRARRALLAELR